MHLAARRTLRFWRTRRRLAAGAAALVVLAGGGATSLAIADGPATVHRENHVFSMPETPGSGQDVRIDTSFFTSGPPGRRPAVMLAHGFGGSKDDMTGEAEALARDGYAVLTWSARGFGRSTGQIGLDSPDREVADVRRLIDWLGHRPEVQLDGPDDPRVGIAGASYGGAIALLAAAYDKRVDAIAPQITWWDLVDALFPQHAQGQPAGSGVFKKLWAGIFFTTGSTGTSPAPGSAGSAGSTGSTGSTGGCRFTAELCAVYERAAVSGRADPETVKLLEESSPSSVGNRIKVPTLIVQGQNDSLFPLDQGDAMARTIAANGAPVSVDWSSGGHDGGDQEDARVQARVQAWFDRYLKGERTNTGPAFRVTRSGGVDTTTGQPVEHGASDGRYPGLLGTDERRIPLYGRPQTVSNPAGGSPPAISSVPGIGALSQLSSLGQGLTPGLSLDFPGQHAVFDSAPLTSAVTVTGAPQVRVTVGSDAPDGEAVLFAKVYDVGPNGSETLPHQLVAPLRVTGAGGGGRTVTVTLPAIDHAFAAGHRMRLVLASTDLSYSSPTAPATYRLSLAGGAGAGSGLAVPLVPALTTAQADIPAWTWALPVAALAAATLLLFAGRKRTAERTSRHRSTAGLAAAASPDPRSADPGTSGPGSAAGSPIGPPAGSEAGSAAAPSPLPLEIIGVSKRYHGSADRYAVRDLSFHVGPGRVLGLLGPNGAGKTTTMRMLMGLIRPDEGEIRIFGQPVAAGAPVLSRVGAFVEGPGFLPHLTGRANLDLYWRATGRPAQDAHVAEALEIAGLGEALDRAVRTYSQGMRQRLAIAQAMLGLPDLLILDEPTNGLDPPQIREMRTVVARYAATGRTVIVSSHLLSEVEQSCTHLVVMDKGQLIAAGPVDEIVGSGDTLFVGVTRISDAALEDAAARLSAHPGIAAASPAADGLLVRLDGLGVPDLLAELLRLDVPVERFGPHRRLEEAFLTLIGGPA
ncbi:alpha/beta fold hydrolase [Streptomyces sp. RB6PN25]|uniref:Alpha/beta fold hydrolase n=1 Tax=Streptomyces humicola TaxID=2953240 RepID=A0ABT1PXR5_9ACTN|nr:alpha/beta fold hydrolase [Streptomyces humicola]MCQ4082457.1 alpha/beta fold hydrolase [Streptomyces humicola]